MQAALFGMICQCRREFPLESDSFKAGPVDACVLRKGWKEVRGLGKFRLKEEAADTKANEGRSVAIVEENNRKLEREI